MSWHPRRARLARVEEAIQPVLPVVDDGAIDRQILVAELCAEAALQAVPQCERGPLSEDKVQEFAECWRELPEAARAGIWDEALAWQPAQHYLPALRAIIERVRAVTGG